MEAIISTIVANVATLVVEHREGITGPKDRVAVPFQHVAGTRYDRSGFNKLRHVVDTLATLGLLRKHDAVFRRRRTGIEASGSLLAELEVPDWTLAEVGKAEGEETVWLSLRMGRDQWGRKLPSEPLDYADTEETRRMREEMEALNAFLNAQRIELDGEPQAAFTLTRRFLLRASSDPQTFALHGRLHGAFWINLREERRAGLTINGEPIADLDFKSMFPWLAYISLGLTPPEGDLYAIPGLEEHRKGVKRGLAALFSKPNEMTKLPPEVKKRLPEGWDAGRFRDAVKAKHPAIAHLFGRDIGLDFMFTESRIMMAALKHLMREGVPALPIHDGAMVPASKAHQAISAMEAAAMEIVGRVIPVEVKT